MTGPLAYLRFVRDNRGLLLFGFLLAFASSIGQTYFIGIFGAAIRADLGLSLGAFGLAYSAATLASGLTLVRLGREADRRDTRRLAALVCLGAAAAGVLLASATGIVAVALAFFGLRLCGQGLLSHVALTATAKAFTRDRGKAVAFAALGFPASEAVAPLVAVAALSFADWRTVWLTASAAFAVIVLPTVFWVHALGGRGAGPAEAAPQLAAGGAHGARLDRRFALLLPAVATPGLVVTGIVFHQAFVAEARGWPLSWWAASFAAAALAHVPAAVAAGALVDRFSAARLIRVFLLPLAFGTATLALIDHPAAAPVFMVSAAMTFAMSNPVVTGLWAELYGVSRLGEIRGLANSAMVIASALSPVAFGVLIDRGLGVTGVALLCLGCIAAAGTLALAAGARRVA